MRVIKKESEFGLNIFLVEGDKNISIIFGGNGDLYWSLHSNNVVNDNSFIITKENHGVYELFEQLFNDIENINLFYDEGIYEKCDKDEYRLFNCSNYNELFDGNVITWYSDETSHEVANILRIIKEDESFKLEFIIQNSISGYDDDFHSAHYIPIRFRNSGSFYFPFNVVFMRMYNAMKNIDDINDYGHQMHIEEYLFKIKKLKRF